MTDKFLRWLIIAWAVLLTACLDITITQVAPSPQASVTPPPAAEGIFPTVTPNPTVDVTASPTTEATTLPAVTSLPERSPEDVALLWQAASITSPVALAGSVERVGVLTADGTFAWLDGRTGQVQAQTALWDDAVQGASTGEIIVEGSLAIVAVQERTTDPDTGRVAQRAKVTVLDGEGNVVWALEELTDGRFYTLSISGGTLLVGTAPRGSAENGIGGYELFTGGRLWVTDDTPIQIGGQTPTPPPTEQVQTQPSGYAQLTTAGGLGFALVDNGTGGAVMAFSPNNGDVLWLRQNRSEQPLRRFAIHNLRVYALSDQTLLILDGETGDILLRSAFPPDVNAGIAPFDSIAAVAPAPTDTLTRPGIIGFDVSGNIRWHSVIGLQAQALAAGEGVVWATLADFDEGIVSLSVLNAADGLELRRLRVSENLNALFTVEVRERRVYVLGDVLYAFGY